MPRYWYRMCDAKPNGVMPVTRDEAPRWNAKGFGIFWTVNWFKTPERRIENLERIAAWAVDMDSGSKTEQEKRLMDGPLVPTYVVETKRGYQAYWGAKDGEASNWNALVLERLVPYFGADANARDLARILRVPGFNHCKDPADPFPVREVWRQSVGYTEQQLFEAFPATPARTAHEATACAVRRQVATGATFWDRLWALDCREALARISGHSAVSGETFTFRRTSKGAHNVYVNGKGTSCWVDQNGRIGSLDRGGPTMYQWIAWYRNLSHPRDIVAVLKQVFPELEQ